MNGPQTLQFSHLCKSWPGLELLDDVELTLKRGSISVLSGENGSGKTTLLRILSGLERPDTCQVKIDTQISNWKRARKRLMGLGTYLHQQPYMFTGTVFHNLSLCLPGIVRKEESYELVNEALEWGMLTRHAFSNAKTLSGGQQQRLALARAWLRRSLFVYLDEPIASMDAQSSTRTLELLSQLRDTGTGILVCTHNIRFFDSLADFRLELAEQKVNPTGRLRHAGNVTYLNSKSPDNIAS